MSWAIVDLRPDLATFYKQANTPGAQESAARRFWHAFLGPEDRSPKFRPRPGRSSSILPVQLLDVA